jgi:Na+-driven multidrug efflux pump
MVYAGEAGVAAYGVMMYVNFTFLSTFIGFVVGLSPVVSYHFGAGNKEELKSLLNKSGVIIGIASLAMFILAQLLSYPLSYIFVSYDADLLALTARGFSIFAFGFIFSGIGILGSSFFTALNDGVTSAIISFLRTIVFQIAAILILPIFLDIDGIWISVAVAEMLATIVTVLCLLLKRKKYGY